MARLEAVSATSPGGRASPASPVTRDTVGSTAAFAAIYERHFHDVCRWLRAFGAPEGDLEDLSQEVFLVARRRFAGFDGRSPSGWLYQIARRVARDARRRSWWRHLFTRREVPALDELPHDGDGPAEHLDRREARRALHGLLARMTEKRRAVFVLAEIEGYATDEIAALEGVAPATVFSRLHYARRDFLALVKKQRQAERRNQKPGGSHE